MYFPDRGCVHTLLTLYVYATGPVYVYYVWDNNFARDQRLTTKSKQLAYHRIIYSVGQKWHAFGIWGFSVAERIIFAIVFIYSRTIVFIDGIVLRLPM